MAKQVQLAFRLSAENKQRFLDALDRASTTRFDLITGDEEELKISPSRYLQAAVDAAIAMEPVALFQFVGHMEMVRAQRHLLLSMGLRSREGVGTMLVGVGERLQKIGKNMLAEFDNTPDDYVPDEGGGTE